MPPFSPGQAGAGPVKREVTSAIARWPQHEYKILELLIRRSPPWSTARHREHGWDDRRTRSLERDRRAAEPSARQASGIGSAGRDGPSAGYRLEEA